MGKPTKKPKDEEVIYLRLPPPLKEAVKKKAREADRSVQAEVRRALTAWVEA